MNLPPGYVTDTVLRLETNLDDLAPEISGAVMGRLFAAGALDVWFTPAQMKKNRPGIVLSVLCAEELLQEIADIVLTETTAFGLRVEKVTRLKLEREFVTVKTDFGDVTLKLGLKGGAVVQAAPEFESCRTASEQRGVPLRSVYEAALRAWHQQPIGHARSQPQN